MDKEEEDTEEDKNDIVWRKESKGNWVLICVFPIAHTLTPLSLCEFPWLFSCSH